jgi:predicted RNase H-like HicB family nuclease
METIKVIIEKTKDMYSAYAENTKGIYAGGETVEEVKQ